MQSTQPEWLRVLTFACFAVALFVAGGVTGSASKGAQSGAEREWVSTFAENPADLETTGRNAFFVLEPGYFLRLEGREGPRQVVLTITVLDETVTVDGVVTRVVEERETVGGKVVEISRNFMAISRKTKNVYYFGEDSEEIDDGKVVAIEGTWRAGRNGATYGLLFPAEPRVGARYYQEHSPGEAMDRAEIVAVEESVTVPAGTFTGCVRVEETNPLEPGSKEYKLFAPGIGVIVDGSLRLTSHGFRPAR